MEPPAARRAAPRKCPRRVLAGSVLLAESPASTRPRRGCGEGDRVRTGLVSRIGRAAVAGPAAGVDRSGPRRLGGIEALTLRHSLTTPAILIGMLLGAVPAVLARDGPPSGTTQAAASAPSVADIGGDNDLSHGRRLLQD